MRKFLGALLLVVSTTGVNAALDLTTAVEASPLEVASPQMANAKVVHQVDVVAVGQGHTCVLKADVPWCAGSNQSGQLGDGADLSGDWSRNSFSPSLMTGAVSIAAGSYHSCAIRGDATMWCWGNNVSGQLGTGNTNNASVPAQVNLAKVRQLALGSYHSCAVLADATVWCWGRNTNGQLGLGHTKNRMQPVKLALPPAMKVVAGAAHTCAITVGNAMWCWGWNQYGQLGFKGRGQKPSPVLLSKVRAKTIAVGGAHTCYVGMRGATWCWGRNQLGQLARLGGPTSTAVRMPVGPALGIYALNDSTCTLQTTSLLWCWGRNASGELGAIASSPSRVPVLAPVSAVSAVVARGNHVCAVHSTTDPNLNDGVSGVSCWGHNIQGQLGDTANMNRATASRVRFPGVALAGTAANADGSVRIAIAGDIGCQPTVQRADIDVANVCVDHLVASLLERRAPNAVVAAGDLQYWRGEYANFVSSYEPRWGRLKSTTYPVRGNHEYITPGADGYVQYWGEKSLPYYSADIGAWRMFVVDSTCLEPNSLGQCETGTPQEKWLRDGLAVAAAEAKCALVVMHHPIVSSGYFGAPELGAMWSTIVNGGADVVVTAHDHIYERFARLDGGAVPVPAGVVAPSTRLFISGLGGMPAHSFVEPPEAGSEFRYRAMHGALELTLSAGSYNWGFVTTNDVVQDAGSDACS